ncbi:hypothetical protein TNCV_916231 [Trichonephila clavipes]|nr:hypothetical protein TNCV_916231 [Trichonephila clavipes]
MQKETTGRSQPPRHTAARNDRWIMHVAGMDRAATSRTKTNRFRRIIRCPFVPFNAACSRVECSRCVYSFVYP